MYTSGSTGRPKGVEVPHRAILRLALDNGYAVLGADDRVAFAANPAFDATTMEVWAPLLTGGCVVVVHDDAVLDPIRLAAVLAARRVTTMFLSTAVFTQCATVMPEAFNGLRYVLTGGERCDPQAFARVLQAGGPQQLLHVYGPTETTTWATSWVVAQVPERAQTLPIGRPISNTETYVLD